MLPFSGKASVWWHVVTLLRMIRTLICFWVQGVMLVESKDVQVTKLDRVTYQSLLVWLTNKRHFRGILVQEWPKLLQRNDDQIFLRIESVLPDHFFSKLPVCFSNMATWIWIIHVSKKSNGKGLPYLKVIPPSQMFGSKLTYDLQKLSPTRTCGWGVLFPGKTWRICKRWSSEREQRLVWTGLRSLLNFLALCQKKALKQQNDVFFFGWKTNHAKGPWGCLIADFNPDVSSPNPPRVWVGLCCSPGGSFWSCWLLFTREGHICKSKFHGSGGYLVGWEGGGWSTGEDGEAWEAMNDWRYWILSFFFWRVWGVCSEIEVNEGFSCLGVLSMAPIQKNINSQ